MTTIVALTGSIRRESLNRRLLVAAERELAALGVTVEPIEHLAATFPLYNADLQAEDGIPDAVTEVHDRIAAASGVLLASPEYNGAFSPLLKNTIDWVTRIDMRVFQPRLIGLLAATPGARGGVKGLALLEQMFANMFCTVHRPHFSLPGAADALRGTEIVDPAVADSLRVWCAGYRAGVDAHVAAFAAKAAEGA